MNRTDYIAACKKRGIPVYWNENSNEYVTACFDIDCKMGYGVQWYNGKIFSCIMNICGAIGMITLYGLFLYVNFYL